MSLRSPAQRLRVDRNHLHIEVFSPAADTSDFADVIEQVYAIFEPVEPSFLHYRSSLSTPLAEGYETARRLLASSVAGVGVASFGDTFDCAILVDQRTDVGVAKYEFGVVAPVELAARISGELPGRLDQPESRLMRQPASSSDLDRLAEASAHLFVDSHWSIEGLPADSSDDVLSSVLRVEEAAAGLVSGLRRSFDSLSSKPVVS